MSAVLQQSPDFDAKLKELCALDGDATRAAYLDSEPDLICPEAVERLSEIVRKRVQVDIQEGWRAAESAVMIAIALDDATSKGIALRAKANVLRLKGQCRAAVDLLKNAVEFFETASRIDEVGRTLSTSIQPLILLGQYDQALASAARARRIFKRQNDGLRLARLELNVANVFHRQERFASALARYESAYEALLPYGDTEGIAVALHNLSVCLISLNDFERALQFYDRALEFFRTHDLPQLAVQADYNIAYLYYLRGDYEVAIDRLRLARESARRQGDAYHGALCDLDLSEIYVELNMSHDAAQMAQLASEQFERLGMGYENARSLINLAAAYSQMNQRSRAIDPALRAQQIFSDEKHRAGLSTAALYLAILHFEDGETEQALTLCRAARQFFESAGLLRKTIICDLLLARAELSRGDSELAREYLEGALNKLKSLRAPMLTFQAQFLFGRVHELAGDSNKSFRRYERARKELEKVSSSLRGEELKIALMRNKLDVYERLIAWCLQHGSTGAAAEKAFQYMEQAKCRGLMESILGRAQPLAARIAQDSGAGDQIRSLRGRLNWLYHRIDQEELRPEDPSPHRIRQLWKEARECEKALVRLLQEIPGVAKPHSTLPGASALSLGDIRSTLPSESALVEYCEVDGHFIAAVLTQESLEIVRLTSTDRLIEECRMLRFQLSKFLASTSFSDKVSSRLVGSTERHLRILYRLLVEPIRHLLKAQHLVFVPHGLLHSLPLHALFDGNQYLIDRYTISYAPSASIYTLCQSRPSVQAGPSVVLGVHDAKAPWILHEARNVAQVASESKLFIGEEATREALQRWGPGSRRIHLATHGLFRADNPLFSSVRLADSHLSLYDLYGLRLPVDLFTMSGCGTALNVVDGGDELMGLARGLLYAGANTLLLTLWNVHDRSTAEFMLKFYSELDSGTATKASALRSAALKLREQYPHPYYWAPFVLIGSAPQ